MAKKEKEPTLGYRYPGTKTFAREQNDLFFGRKDDVEKIFQDVLQHQCIVIFGKSGVGKSSLINAGLLPKIENEITKNKEDKRCFTIGRIRFGTLEDQNQKILIKRLNEAPLSTPEPEKEPLPFLPAELKDSFWYKLKKRQFNSFLNGSVENFILIFDQLEELFNYPADQIKEVLFELADLQRNTLPDKIRNEWSQIKREGGLSLSEPALAALYTPLPVKFVFAIRSDRLSLVARLKKAIPSIMQITYELMPLSKEQARDAITEPARSNLNFLTPPFEYDEAALTLILNYLHQSVKNEDISLEGKCIEPFNLQIICSHIEGKLVEEQKISKISVDKLPELGKILREYYNEKMEKLFTDEKKRTQIIEITESRFVDEKNLIRKMVYMDDTGISEPDLDLLCDEGIFRKETRGSKEIYYEITHDRLLEAIVESKKERIRLQETSSLQKIDSSLLQIQEKIKINPNDYNLYKQVGDYYYLQQQYENAVAEYSKGIQLAENNNAARIDLYQNRANSYFYSGRIEEANNDYREILKLDPKYILAHFYLGYNYQELLKKDPKRKEYVQAAREAYDEVLKLDSKYTSAYYNLGLLNEIDENFDQALSCYDELLKLDPKYESAYNRKGYVFSQILGDNASAEKVLLQGTANIPGSSELNFLLGLVYTEQKQPAKALGAYKKALELNPKDWDAAYRIGLILLDQADEKKNDPENERNYNMAFSYLKRSIEINPDNINAYNELGVLYHNVFKDYDKAYENYMKVIELDPTFSRAYYNLGLIDEMKLRYDNAVRNFLKAIQIDPDYRNAYIKLSTAYSNLADYELSNEILNNYLARFGPDANMYYRLGANTYSLGDYATSVEHYKKAIAIDPLFGDAYYNIGLAYRELGRHDEAIDSFRSAISFNPHDFEAYYYMGTVYAEKKDYKAARENYQISQDINPSFSNAQIAIESLSALQL